LQNGVWWLKNIFIMKIMMIALMFVI
jgi:hypothetical protein